MWQSLATSVLSVLLCAIPAAADEPAEEGCENRPLRITVLDAKGLPLAGAKVGTSIECSDILPPDVRGPARLRGCESDVEGQVEFAREDIRIALEEHRAVICALSLERKLVGFAPLRDVDETVELRTYPWCVLDITGKSTQLAALDQKLKSTLADVQWNDTWPIHGLSNSNRLQFVLPPGKYEVRGYHPPLTHPQSVSLEVLAGETAKSIDFDFPATRLAQIMGRRAPELDVDAWKNSDPLRLADLKGKVVVLDFWGCWCGTCLVEMPELVDLYAQYHDAGLEVIAVHTDDITTIEELDKQLVDIEKDTWNGRPLPFPIAIDSRTEALKPGSTTRFRGMTAAAYGIYGFPTTILIDREGMVVGEFKYTRGRGREQLAEMLGEPSR